MNCACHGEPMRMYRDGYGRCAVKCRERQALYARRKRATSVEYLMTQRRGKLRRNRAGVLDALCQLREEERWLSAATRGTNAS